RGDLRCDPGDRWSIVDRAQRAWRNHRVRVDRSWRGRCGSRVTPRSRTRACARRSRKPASAARPTERAPPPVRLRIERFARAERADPEIEFVVADGTDPGVWTGVARMAGAWREVLSLWDDVRVDVGDYRPLDDERVLVLLTWTGRARGSGLNLAEMPWTGANV